MGVQRDIHRLQTYKKSPVFGVPCINIVLEVICKCFTKILRCDIRLINGDFSRPLTQAERTRRSVQLGVWADGQCSDDALLLRYSASQVAATDCRHSIAPSFATRPHTARARLSSPSGLQSP